MKLLNKFLIALLLIGVAVFGSYAWLHAMRDGGKDIFDFVVIWILASRVAGSLAALAVIGRLVGVLSKRSLVKKDSFFYILLGLFNFIFGITYFVLFWFHLMDMTWMPVAIGCFIVGVAIFCDVFGFISIKRLQQDNQPGAS